MVNGERAGSLGLNRVLLADGGCRAAGSSWVIMRQRLCLIMRIRSV